jgi:hypothetical protein
MPDPSLIHGRAIPAPELPSGTVTVRVVREAIGNNVVGQSVQLTAAGRSRTAGTDEQGRAEFTGLPQGAEATAEATVDGERLVSQPFLVPASGGLRVILVAGLQEAAERRKREAAAGAAAPPVRGTVVLGRESRIVLEFQDDLLHAFYVLEVLNNARTPVDIGGPLIIDLPSGAAGAATFEGSSPNTTVSGDRVTVTGPFPPGTTPVHVRFRLRLDRVNTTIEQVWPARIEQLNVVVERIGTVGISSPQFSAVEESRAEDGTQFLFANGPALPGGATLQFQLTNLPVHSRTPQFVALGIASAILGIGAWLAFSTRGKEQDARRRLVERRDALLAQLAALDGRHRRGGASSDAAYAAKRQRLVSELEHLYGELDEAGSGPQGGGEGIAA